MSPPRLQLIGRRAAAIEPSATLEVAARASALKAQGESVIAFAAGEPDLGVPAEIMANACQAINAGRGRYTAAAGLPELREAIARKFRRDGYLYDATEVLACAGGKAAIFIALFSVLNEGDEVLFPAPYWSSYPDMVRAAGGCPVVIPTRAEEDFQPRSGDVEAALSPRSRVLLLNSPNNPTGTVYSQDTLLGLADFARRAGLVVISDDIYDCLVYTGEPFLNVLSVAPELSDRTVIVNSLSKSHSMTGWRLGYAGGPREIIQAMARVQSQISGNPNSISQIAAITALGAPPDPARAASLDARRRLLLSELQGLPNLPCPVPRGAFYAFPSIAAWLGRSHRGRTVDSSATFSRFLLEDTLVATVPGDAFGAPEHIRLTYTVPELDIREGVRRLGSFLQGFA